MELALTIIAGLGALLFLVSYLSYVASGFKHHFVTGIISALPVLNIVTLPSLWDKSRGKFVIGFIGLVIAAAAWLLGADKGFQNILSKSPSNRQSVAAKADYSGSVQLKMLKMISKVDNIKITRYLFKQTL